LRMILSFFLTHLVVQITDYGYGFALRSLDYGFPITDVQILVEDIPIVNWGFTEDSLFWEFSNPIHAFGETYHIVFQVTNIQTPTANAGPDQTIECLSPEGTQVVLNGADSFDPDGDSLTYEWTWSGGIASGVNPTIVLPLGTTTITLVVNDGTADSEPDTVDITVVDTIPPAICIGPPTQYGLYRVGELALVFSATDATCEPALLARLYAIDWEEDVLVGFEPDAGVYTLGVSACDDSGNTAFSDPVFFVVYDPDAGFVTGGGWIDSPEGAYVDDPSLTGKASFGFVAKYKKGANVPDGQTEFVFKAGDLNFHSTSYQWLVVTGSNYAKFKGEGTINGDGPYKFKIWAGDADTDTFTIKIWTEDESGIETIKYYNGMDQPIGGGSIIVHTSKK